MKTEVYSIDKKKVGDVDLADEVFAAHVNKALFYEVVKMQLASRRRVLRSAMQVAARGNLGRLLR